MTLNFTPEAFADLANLCSPPIVFNFSSFAEEEPVLYGFGEATNLNEEEAGCDEVPRLSGWPH